MNPFPPAYWRAVVKSGAGKCTADTCQRPAVRRGLCWTDYGYWRRNGRPRTAEEILEANERYLIRELERENIRRAIRH